jgi:hypothetical protein
MKTLFRSLVSMAQFSLILLLMTFSVLLGGIATIRNFASFTIVWQRSDALEALENRVSTALREMQKNELHYYYTLSYGLSQDNALEQIAANQAQILAILDELAAKGHFTAELDYAEEQILLVDSFRTLLDPHLLTIDQVAQAYLNADEDTALQILEIAQEENFVLEETLKALIAGVDAERNAALQTFPADVAFAVQGISLAIAAMLLLALLGYRAINHLTNPLHELTNAVIAIGGDRYKAELLGATLRQKGPPGVLARRLDEFAQAIQQRDASLKQEISRLREQFYEARRRRLKVSRPNQ